MMAKKALAWHEPRAENLTDRQSAMGSRAIKASIVLVMQIEWKLK
jgi:hypothetical protein